MKILKLSLYFLIFTMCFARSIEEIKQSGNIVIAVYEDFPPYSFIKNKKATGIDIDIAKEIAKSLHVKPIWYFTGFGETSGDDLRTSIWKGNKVHKTKADLMLRVPYDYDYMRLIDKQTGELKTDMVSIKAPYQSESWVIATRKKAIPKINTLAIFAYHKIGVELDTLPDLHLSGFARGILQKNVKHYTHIQNAIKDLKNGKIDAIAGLKSQLEYLLDYKHNKSKYYITNSIPLMKSKWDLATATDTRYRVLSYHVDGVIEKLYKNGTLEKIFKKYGVTYKPPIAKTQ